MNNRKFFGVLLETLNYDLDDAAPYGYLMEVFEEEVGSKEVAQTICDALSNLEIKVGSELGNITDAAGEKYNPGAYFLAYIPLSIDDAYFSLYPSLLCTGWDMPTYSGICVSGLGMGKSDFDPKNFGLPNDSYFNFLGEFIGPDSLKELNSKAVEALLTYFLGHSSRGFAAAILRLGLDTFHEEIDFLQEYFEELWEVYVEALQSTVNELGI